MAIPFYYDPMIAKMICHDETRERAIEKTIRAIDEYEITGLETTLGFCKMVMQHEAFRSGDFDTKFVEKYFKPELLNGNDHADEALLAALLSVRTQENKKSTTLPASTTAGSQWKKNRA
jgi:propionyl-CoA carboxylase alpha chain